MIMNTFMYDWNVLQEKKSEKFNKKFLIKLPCNINIYLIDGKYVRNHIEVDFIGGGHYYVPYKFIPENEIWLEDIEEGERELDSVLIHEFTERMLMKYMNFGYQDAHKVATKYEKEFRMVDKTDPHKISNVLNNFHKKYFTNDKFYNSDFSDKMEKLIIDIKL